MIEALTEEVPAKEAERDTELLIEDVGVVDAVSERVRVREAVSEGVRVREAVSDTDGVGEDVIELDTVRVTDGVAVLELVSDKDEEDDADSDTVEDADIDAEGVREEDADTDTDAELDGIGTKSYESTKIGSVLLLIICCGLVNWRVRRFPCVIPVEERLVLVKSR